MTRKTVAVAFIALAATLLYAFDLGRAPVHLADDEVFIALSAHSIASTAHDLNGRFLPLYIQWRPQFFNNPWFANSTWFQPMAVYLTALFLKVLPVSDATVRLPTVLVGVSDIVLMYFIAARILTRRLSAIIASALLALTPAHFIHSRFAMDYLYPVPFVMAWLLCLLIFMDRRQPWVLFVATSFLGVGFYSYIAAVVMMPIYLLMTWLVIWKTSTKPMRLVGVAAAGFVWPLLFLIGWLFRHAGAVADTAQRYKLYDPAGQQHVLGLAPLHFLSIVHRMSVYWQFFDPSYLFFTGGGFTLSSTHRAGVFLAPLIVCVPVGIYQILANRRTLSHVVLLAGLATAPLAACLVDEPGAIDRELELLPFGVLIATIGIESLVIASSNVLRLLGIGLVALVPIQFGFFHADYVGDYGARSAVWFGGNIRGAFDQIVDRQSPDTCPAIYLSTEIPFIDWRWRLYAIDRGKENLLARTVYFQAGNLAIQSVPPRSVMLVGADDAAAQLLVRSGQLHNVGQTIDLDRRVCCLILER